MKLPSLKINLNERLNCLLNLTTITIKDASEFWLGCLFLLTVTSLRLIMYRHETLLTLKSNHPVALKSLLTPIYSPLSLWCLVDAYMYYPTRRVYSTTLDTLLTMLTSNRRSGLLY